MLAEPVENRGSLPDSSGRRAVPKGPFRRWRWVLLSVAAVVLLLSATAVGALIGRENSEPHARLSPPLYPGDDVQFVGDVTFPDGSVVEPGERFSKVWEFQNTGEIGWHDRFLQREQLPEQSHDCHTPERVPIGDAWPGERVKISVPVTAREVPGSCVVSWKMVDAHDNSLFPGFRPVYFWVRVQR